MSKAVQLPNGQSAIIYSKDEITERTSRNISRAYMKAAGTAGKLSSLGFDDTKPETWTIFAELSDDDQANLDGYQASLIVGMVKSWSLGDLPTMETALDLTKPIFDELSKVCGDEFNQTEDFSHDNFADPKAPTAD